MAMQEEVAYILSSTGHTEGKHLQKALAKKVVEKIELPHDVDSAVH